ncbi:hypothetical protein [Ichthyenterobacterium magnum]|uniref:Uncharacterized protein n=1 Tax=Ichthyenterobacterium magnum TaxID=1230530 RepID=A0A420DBZ5_9FLAO|nr:hypothetical protein [Ichthyenterobacterium magnum]RKE89428.1 hypothetical protein BXY80_2777 [Ichthyenterobacterium magnum]
MKETSEHTIKIFLKFGQKEHIKDLFENGTIFLNSIEYFRKLEDNGLRGDRYEGISKLHNLPSGEFEIKSLNYKGKYISMQIRESYQEIIGNIYSLYAVSSFGFPNPLEFKIDDRNSEFGSHCLMIKNLPLFFQKIEQELNNLKLKFRHGFVKYYDASKFNGQITLFQKPMEYEYQKEFRFYVERNSTEPLILNIGSLKDIAEIYESKELIKEIELTVK